jgi:hypothetical protein
MHIFRKLKMFDLKLESCILNIFFCGHDRERGAHHGNTVIP